MSDNMPSEQKAMVLKNRRTYGSLSLHTRAVCDDCHPLISCRCEDNFEGSNMSTHVVLTVIRKADGTKVSVCLFGGGGKVSDGAS